MITRQTINNALALAKTHAIELQTAAAHDGRHDDGGAGQLNGLIHAYIAGTEGTVPGFLEPFMKKAQAMDDPEYRQYMNLRRKFEGQ